VAYLGFSAETGELVDDHDIISVQTKNLYAPAGSSSGLGGDKGRSWGGSAKKKEGGGWGWFFIKFCLFGFVVVGVYVGFAAYRTQRSRSRF